MENRFKAETRTKRRSPATVLAWLCALLVLAGVLPLYAIAFDNHPYYDDYGFSANVHQAWTQTHSLGNALVAAWKSAKTVRTGWQGTYTGTLLSNLQPGVFSENLYWVTTFLLLTVFLLCFYYLFKTVFRGVLLASRAETVCIASLALFLMTQFLPAPNEAFYWFNGGIGNTFIYSLLALSLALMVKLYRAARRAPGLVAALFLLAMLLGGGSYGGGLLGILLFMLFCVFAFTQKNRHRWVFTALTLWFWVCFAYSMLAPGNGVRAAMIGSHPSAAKAVLQSLYYGVALLGNYTTLPVAAVALALAPLLGRLAKASPYRFCHPLFVLVGGVCLFCAQLTPPLYGGVFLGAGRITDTYYYAYIVLALILETYFLGAYARRRERLGLPACQLSGAARRGLLVASACLLLTGCIGYKPNGETMYGPMNMAGGSAALSLLTGEAQQYDREMTARETLLNDASQPVVTLSPLSAVPKTFMADLLAPDATYDVRPMLCGYYGKTAILLEGGDAQ